MASTFWNRISAGPAIRKWIHKPTVLVVAVLWSAYMAVGAFIVAVDPYDLYPWGAHARMPSNREPFEVMNLMRLAAKDPIADTVLIGSSPTTMYSPDDILEAFPGSKSAWNVSYHAGTAYDRHITINEFAKYSRAKHFIVTLDFFYATVLDRKRSTFPDYMYDGNPTHAFRMISAHTLKAAIKTIVSGSPFPDKAGMERQEHEFNEGERRKYHSPEQIDEFRKAIDKYRNTIAAVGKQNCGDFPMLPRLIADVRALAAHGATVDLFIPAYSPVAYYFWADNPDFRNLVGSAALYDQMQMRRCVVLETADIPRTKVSSLDLDFARTSDYANFRDMTHLYDTKFLKRWLSMSRDPQNTLTAQNVDAYVATMIDRVKNYTFKDSELAR